MWLILADKCSCKHADLEEILIQIFIGILHDNLRRRLRHEAGLAVDRCASHGHEQRGGHALTSHIGDRKDKRTVGISHEIIEVAAHLKRRLRGSVNIEFVHFRQLLGQQPKLHAARQIYLGL
jgi:hypothetical protein